MKNELVKCCRCRNKHKKDQRTHVQDGCWTKLVCPRCGAEPYYALNADGTENHKL